MSDDLVKRLRAFASPDAELLDDGYRLTKMCHQSHEAADRIEELEAQLSEKMDEDAYIGELEFQLTNALEAYGRLKELETKLAVAVELVEEAYCEGFAEGHAGGWIEGDYSKPWKKSALFTTIAELSSTLKGQDDE